MKALTGNWPVLFVSWNASNRTLGCMMTGIASELENPSLCLTAPDLLMCVASRAALVCA